MWALTLASSFHDNSSRVPPDSHQLSIPTPHVPPPIKVDRGASSFVCVSCKSVSDMSVSDECVCAECRERRKPSPLEYHVSPRRLCWM